MDANTPRSGTIIGNAKALDGQVAADMAQAVAGNIFRGQIVDVYANRYSCRVAIVGLSTPINCVWLSKALSFWSGVKDFGLPASNGTTVLVYVPSDGQANGIVLGCVPNSSEADSRYPVAIGSGISCFQPDSGQDPVEGGAAGVPDAGAGMPTDTLPGDYGFMNEYGVMIGVLKLMASLKASELAKIEAFVMDDLLNIVGHNMNIFSSLGEARIRNDHGRVTLEWLATGTQSESMGAQETATTGVALGGDFPLGKEVEALDRGQPFETSNPPINDKTRAGTGPLGSLTEADCAVGKWRLKAFVGALADFAQIFLCYPNKYVGSLANPKDHPDTGLFHAHLDSSGRFLARSVTGMGMMKTSQISVPKKEHELDDPAGDIDFPDAIPKKDFEYSQTYLAGISCQLRDSMAYMFGAYAPRKILDQPKDYDVPEESSCPVPGERVAPNSINSKGFWMNLPGMDQKVGGDTTKNAGPQAYSNGDSWVLLLPDGSVSIRDKWGSQADFRGGHISLSAAKDLQISAGRNIILTAGHDIVGRAKESVDFTTTDGQVRLKGQGAVLVHSEEDGILLSSSGKNNEPLSDYGSDDAKGEKFHVPGIVIKSEKQSVFVDARKFNVNLDSSMLLSGRTKGQYPSLYMRLAAHLEWLAAGPGLIVKTDDEYAQLSQGTLRVSRSILAQGSIKTDKSISSREGVFTEGRISAVGQVSTAGSLFAQGAVIGNNGPSQKVFTPQGTFTPPTVPPITPTVESSVSDSFQSERWDEYQGPLSLDKLSDINFSFRSTQEYGAEGGIWFEHYWQREVQGLSEWEEKPIDNRYPYPGEKHFKDAASWITYKESNVDQSGQPKERKVVQEGVSGGEFSAQSLNKYKIHP